MRTWASSSLVPSSLKYSIVLAGACKEAWKGHSIMQMRKRRPEGKSLVFTLPVMECGFNLSLSIPHYQFFPSYSSRRRCGQYCLVVRLCLEAGAAFFPTEHMGEYAGR